MPLSSKLRQRAGDLRFRRDNELNQMVCFMSAVQTHLQMLAEDISDMSAISTAPILVAGDARALRVLPSLDCDTVITSPPYLNGTNYFRNTKIELWFLRALRTTEDLSIFRRSAVTAGINDVTRQKLQSSNDAVREIVEALATSAYDARIPQMVSSYFRDMEDVLDGMTRHLRHGAVIAIDIGDSVYAGQRVPTDTLLVGIARTLGFVLQQSVLLRNRVSRDTTPLKQVLLIFEYHGDANSRAVTGSSSAWSPAWQKLKTELPHQHAPYAKRNWGHPLHSLCSYQGKMKPSLAHFLVRTFAPHGGRILGVPLRESERFPLRRHCRASIVLVLEISPAALHIAGAKLGVHHRREVTETLS